MKNLRCQPHGLSLHRTLRQTLIAAGLTISLLETSTAAAQTFVSAGTIRPGTFWTDELDQADFNGDGVEEVLALEGFIGEELLAWSRTPTGDWTNELITQNWPSLDYFISDLDGDGRDDVVTMKDNLALDQFVIHFGRSGVVGFDPVSIPVNIASGNVRATAVDFDGDGDRDLAVMGENELLILENAGARQFTELYRGPDSDHFPSLTAFDIDGDGFEDLVRPGNGRMGWRRSLGNGRFLPTRSLIVSNELTTAYELEVHDMDGDGDLDLVCTAARGQGLPDPRDQTSYWLQMGPGLSTVFRSDHLSAAGALEEIDQVRDIDLDGVLDLVMHDRSTALLYRRGLGGGAFGAMTQFPMSLVDAATGLDVDLDGDMDLVTSSGAWFENTDVLGDVVCAGEPNSAGPGADLGGRGSLVVSVNRLTLRATGMPPSAIGLLLTSAQPTTATRPPGSQGLLCLGGTIGRFNRPGEMRLADQAGVFDFTLNLADLPDALLGSVAVVAPDTRFFQVWYRDQPGGVPVSNFTAALRTTLR